MGQTVDIFKTQYFKFCRLNLLLTGQWPNQSKMITIPVRIFLIITGMVFANAVLWKIITSRHDMRVLIETLPPWLTCMGASIKYFNAWINLTKMKKLMQKVQYDWECAFLNKEDHIFEIYARKVWKVNLSYTIIIYSMASIYLTLIVVPELLSKLASRNITRFTHQPVQVEFFVDEDKYFLYTLIFISTNIVGAIAVIIVLDMQLNIIINHACTMFAVVGYRLENMFRFDLVQRDKNAEIERILVRTVKYHSEAMTFVEGINSYCSISYVLLCGVGIILFSILLVHVCIVIKASESYDVIAIPVMNFIGHVIMLYFNTILAQRMIDISSNVFHQIYCGEWFTAPTSIQKMLLIIMQKTLKPATIIFANLVTLSREKVAMILESSMSYFMVLYSLQ